MKELALKKLYNKIVTNCKQCDNGVLLINGEFIDCTCMIEFRKQSIILLGNIPKRHSNFDLRMLTAAFKKANEIPVTIIRKFVENIERNIEEGNSLFFQSMPGLGKTALSCYVLTHALKLNYKASFIRFSDLITLVFKSIDQKSAQDHIKYLQDSDIICIDRIDSGYVKGDNSDYASSRLDELFNHFYDSQIPLLVTSKIPKTEVIDMFSFGTIFDDFVDIAFSGNSFRGSESTLKRVMND